MNKCPMSPDYFYEGLRELGMTGVEEGVLSGQIPATLIGVSILTQLVGYVTCIQRKEWMDGISMEQLKEFVYHGIVSSLN